MVAVGACLLALGGCATTGPVSKDDPFEPWNRAMYDVHEAVDGTVVRPLVQGYVDIVPAPIRQGVTNFFGNIDDLFTATAGLAAGKFDLAGHSLGRFIVNTLFGIGGLIDVASSGDIPKYSFDYGLTLGAWGLPQGPYLFVPMFGPTTVRDGAGWVARAYTGPLGYLIDDVPVRNTLYGTAYFDVRAGALPAQEMVEKAAIDKYTFVRRAYLQRRRYLLYEGQPPPEKEDEE
jgi:phospholipid-binding lipoprotein MlaA